MLVLHCLARSSACTIAALMLTVTAHAQSVQSHKEIIAEIVLHHHHVNETAIAWQASIMNESTPNCQCRNAERQRDVDRAWQRAVGRTFSVQSFMASSLLCVG